MKRRNVLIGLGGLAGAGSFIGTSAFATAELDRSVSIAVADDNSAYLKLTQRGGGRRSYADGSTETVGFDFPGPNEDDYGSTNPEGVGTDSVYRFGRDADPNSEPGLFGITNQGTQPVEIYSTQSTTSDVPSVTIFDVESGDLLTESSPSDPLTVGDQLLCGLEIDTHGVEIDDYDVALTINAMATDASD